MKTRGALFRKMRECKKGITIPTLLTMLRIALVPGVVAAMIFQSWGHAFFLFSCAALTDIADGLLARRWDDKTVLGACLDPIADKILVISCFLTLLCMSSPLFLVPSWLVALVLCREAIVLVGAIVLIFASEGFDVAPTKLGKVTMVAQSTFVAWLLFCRLIGHTFACLDVPFTIAVAVLVVLSCLHYVCIGSRHFVAMVVRL